MGVKIVNHDPFAAQPQTLPAPTEASAPASGGKGKSGKPEAPASARDELMRVIFADGTDQPFVMAAREAGDQLRQKAREGRQPFYDDAYAQGATGFESPELDKMATSPLFARAMQRAETTVNDRAAIPGQSSTGVRGANGRTLEYWDQVSQRLDDMRAIAKRSGAETRVTEIDKMRKGLRGHLDKAFSKYGATRGALELFFDANDPVEAGMKFAGGRYPLAQVQQVLATVGSDEKKLFSEGFMTAFIDMARAAPDRKAVLDRMKLLEGEQNKVRLALGARADQLEAFLRLEGLISGKTRADPVKDIADMMVRGSESTEMPLNRGVAEQIARKLTSRDPDMFLDGLKLAAKPHVLENLRAAGIAEAPAQGGDAESTRIYQRARDAVARGADKTAVMKRLSDNGYNPRGL